MHSGGRTAGSSPARTCTSSTIPSSARAMLAGMEAWNTDHRFLYIDVNGTGLLPVEAENQGKLVITTELGGSGRVPPDVHRARLEPPHQRAPPRRRPRGRSPDPRLARGPDAVILDGRDPANFVDFARGRAVRGHARASRRCAAGDPSGGSGSSTARPAGRDARAPLDGVVAVTKRSAHRSKETALRARPADRRGSAP